MLSGASGTRDPGRSLPQFELLTVWSFIYGLVVSMIYGWIVAAVFVLGKERARSVWSAPLDEARPRQMLKRDDIPKRGHAIIFEILIWARDAMPKDLGAPLHVMARARQIARSGSCSSVEEIMSQLLREGLISTLHDLFSLPEALELRRLVGAPPDG